MPLEHAWLVPLGGIVVGLIMGYMARRYNFCTLSSLERYWYANDSSGLRTWVLAIAVAIASTLLLTHTGIIDLTESFYLRASLNIPGAVVGGLLFGIGMALTGTCGFGALVRLGSGSLRSLVVVVALGLAAVTTQRGVIGHIRQSYIEPLTFDLSWAGSQSVGAILSAMLGMDMHLFVGIACITGLSYWVFRSSRYRAAHGLIATGFVMGLCITAGWCITYAFQQHSFEIIALEAGSFVLPPGELIMFSLIATGIPDYTAGLVIGVVAGASISARQNNGVRWEACDDAREFGRHLAGAFSMGVGGVLATGCTIGQGISAASTLAISAPIVFFSILLGARVGLSWLLEGSAMAFIRSR